MFRSDRLINNSVLFLLILPSLITSYYFIVRFLYYVPGAYYFLGIIDLILSPIRFIFGYFLVFAFYYYIIYLIFHLVILAIVWRDLNKSSDENVNKKAWKIYYSILTVIVLLIGMFNLFAYYASITRGY